MEPKVGEVNEEEQSLEGSEKSCFTERSVNTLFVSTYVQQPFLEIVLKKLLTLGRDACASSKELCSGFHVVSGIT